jgi:hypothetical protein
LVACYFACEGGGGHAAHDGEVVALQPRQVNVHSELDNEHLPWDLTATSLVFPTAVAGRIIAQRGLFSVHHQPDVAWTEPKLVQRFVIPAALKLEMKRLLIGLGVDQHALMPDLDGLAAALKWRYLHSIPLGA